MMCLSAQLSVTASIRKPYNSIFITKKYRRGGLPCPPVFFWTPHPSKSGLRSILTPSPTGEGLAVFSFSLRSSFFLKKRRGNPSACGIFCVASVYPILILVREVIPHFPRVVLCVGRTFRNKQIIVISSHIPDNGIFVVKFVRNLFKLSGFGGEFVNIVGSS